MCKRFIDFHFWFRIFNKLQLAKLIKSWKMGKFYRFVWLDFVRHMPPASPTWPRLIHLPLFNSTATMFIFGLFCDSFSNNRSFSGFLYNTRKSSSLDNWWLQTVVMPTKICSPLSDFIASTFQTDVISKQRTSRILITL